ncbi:MAG: hypothetical protein WC371_00945 [Parachlamydiales bacterium]|jgi:hypothetical protein
MTLTEENRKYILNEFLEDIWGISDLEYQKRVWLRGEGPECDSIGETINRFFDTAEFLLPKYKEFHISKNQYQILKKFYKEFEAFSQHCYQNPLEFIDSQEWARVMDRAKEVLQAFDYKSEN